MGSGKPLIEPATAESIVAKRGTTTTNGAGDGSTVVDTGLTEANDYWNDMTILILSGACDGQSRDITDFAGGTLTVSPVFSNQIVAGVRYLILPIKPSFAEIADLDVLIDAIKAKTDILPAANVDVSGSFTWVTATHTTDEGDISALFSTPLTGSTRRKYAVFVDLTAAEADAAAWTTCTVRVKVGFGAADAYRTVDLKEIAKTDVAAAKEPGVPIDVPATAKNVQITLQFDVALNSDATIYYSYIKEVLE